MLCTNCKATVFESAPLSISSDDLNDLFRSSYTHTSARISEIPGVIAGIDSDIRHNEARIHHLKAEISMLENKQRISRYQQKRFLSLLAPVRRLPSELLSLIFTFYVEMYEQCNIIDSYRSRRWVRFTGCTLMGVCKRWRDIAMANTSQWTRLSLCVWDDDNTMHRASLNWLVRPTRLCMGYAGATAPLDLEMQGSFPGGNWDLEAFKLLTAQASRWRHITIVSDRQLAQIPVYAELAGRSLPSLESLSIEADPTGWDSLEAEMELFSNAPKLTELSLKFGPRRVNSTHNTQSFPWSQIDTLDLEYIGEDSVFAILPLCSILRSLHYTFHDNKYIEGGHPTVVPQTSETVSSLFISILDGYFEPNRRILDRFLQSARFPSLNRMSVDFIVYTAELSAPDVEVIAWPRTLVTSFLERSDCSLTFLHLEDAFMTDDDLIGLLIHTPELQQFEFFQSSEDLYPEKPEKGAESTTVAAYHRMHRKCRPVSTAFIKSLHALANEDPHKSSNTLVPKLQHLSLKVRGSWFNDGQFVDVALSRWLPDPALARSIGVECLKSVKLKVWGRTIDEELYRPLLDLDGAGMMVEVFGEEGEE